MHFESKISNVSKWIENKDFIEYRPKFEIEVIDQLSYRNSKQLSQYIEKNSKHDFGRAMAKILKLNYRFFHFVF
jgi:hypothetical protein